MRNTKAQSRNPRNSYVPLCPAHKVLESENKILQHCKCVFRTKRVKFGEKIFLYFIRLLVGKLSRKLCFPSARIYSARGGLGILNFWFKLENKIKKALDWINLQKTVCRFMANEYEGFRAQLKWLFIFQSCVTLISNNSSATTAMQQQRNNNSATITMQQKRNNALT